MYVYGFNRNSTPSVYRPIFQLNTMSNTSTVEIENFNITAVSDEMTAESNGVVGGHHNINRIWFHIFVIYVVNGFYLRCGDL